MINSYQKTIFSYKKPPSLLRTIYGTIQKTIKNRPVQTITNKQLKKKLKDRGFSEKDLMYVVNFSASKIRELVGEKGLENLNAYRFETDTYYQIVKDDNELDQELESTLRQYLDREVAVTQEDK